MEEIGMEEIGMEEKSILACYEMHPYYLVL